jgi:hypothetical protein
MCRWIGVCILVGLVVAAPAPSVAGGASPWTQEKRWLDRSDGKFYHGLKNLLLGWTELITEPDEAMWKGESMLVGLVRGAWNAVGQTAGGALHVLTFPFTQFDIPLPEGGVGWDRSYSK